MAASMALGRGGWQAKRRADLDLRAIARASTSHAYPVHVGLPTRREHFDQWLALFRPAAYETLPEDAACRAIAKAEHMAESFRAGLFLLDLLWKPH